MLYQKRVFVYKSNSKLTPNSGRQYLSPKLCNTWYLCIVSCCIVKFFITFLATSPHHMWNKPHYHVFILTILTTDVFCYVIDLASVMTTYWPKWMDQAQVVSQLTKSIWFNNSVGAHFALIMLIFYFNDCKIGYFLQTWTYKLILKTSDYRSFRTVWKKT